MSGFNDTLSTFGGIAVALAASVGLGNLLLAIFQRWVGNEDKRMAIHESNRGAELDYDDKFQDRLLTRLSDVEAEQKILQSTVNDQVRALAALTTENGRLQTKNERQEDEIVVLQAQDVAKVQRIAHLEQQVETLTAEVETLKKMSALSTEDMKTLADSAATIQNSIDRLGFVPTGEPSDDDNAAVQRLKEIRDASEDIARVVGT